MIYTGTFARTSQAALATAAIAVFAFAPPTYDRQDTLLNVLKPVEEKRRPRLAARLRLFMECQRTQRWTELYKLIDKFNAEHVGAEEFPRLMTSIGHVDFEPRRSEPDDPPHNSQYRIYGCVKNKREGKIVWFQGGLVAYLQDGDWYFTPHFLLYNRSGIPILCDEEK